MSFLRFLKPAPHADSPAESLPSQTAARPSPVVAETEAVRRIVGRLEALPPDRARMLAATAYILARAAYADLDISEAETAAMERELTQGAGLDEAQAVLVVEMAKLQERTSGETSDYLVTREFHEHATPDQAIALLRACFHVCLADDVITGMESAVLNEIAAELGLDRTQAGAIRAEFADKFAGRGF